MPPPRARRPATAAREPAATVAANDASLAARLSRAEAELSRLRRRDAEHQQERTQLARTVSELAERAKELDCLYRITALGQRLDLPFDEVVQGAVEMLPPAWQHPQAACARIVLEDREYRSAGFAVGEQHQTQAIVVDGQQLGVIEVCYREPQPPADEGPFLTEERQLLGAVATGIGDLVRRARARRAIDETNANNRALLAAIPDLIFQIDREGALVSFHAGRHPEFSAKLTALLGQDRIGEVAAERVPRRIRERLLVHVQRALTTGRPQVFEQTLTIDRDVHDFEIRLVPNTESVVLGMLRDITERKRLEKEILEISGREQRRIGRDLHDSLCQHLAGVGFLAQALAKRAPPELAGGATEIVGLIDEAITMARSFARGLNPIRLDAEGLVAGLGELAEHTRRIFGVTCHCDHRGRPPDLDGTVALHLYRLAQEAVSNALKHAAPTTIRIELDVTPPTGTLAVEDDGIGLTAALDRGRGMGLSIMRYRAWVIGGTLELGAGATRGTRVVCQFPAS